MKTTVSVLVLLTAWSLGSYFGSATNFKFKTVYADGEVVAAEPNPTPSSERPAPPVGTPRLPR